MVQSRIAGLHRSFTSDPLKSAAKQGTVGGYARRIPAAGAGQSEPLFCREPGGFAPGSRDHACGWSYWLQLGRLAAAVEEPAEPDELPSPVEVDPEAPPVPLAPALPEEPRVPDEPLEPDPIEPELAPRLDDPEEPAPLLAEPTVLLPELDPELEPRLEEEPELNCAFQLDVALRVPAMRGGRYVRRGRGARRAAHRVRT